MVKKKSEFKWAGISPFFHHSIVFNFVPHELKGKTIVEGGCGKGIYGFLIRATRDLEGANLIGVDISDDYLKVARNHSVYDKYITASLQKLPIKKKSVDLYLAVEVLSHLTKDKGRKALEEVDRICRGRSIIVVPNNMKHSQPEFIESDSHHACWNTSDFREFGYKVYGFGARLKPPSKSWQIKLYFAIQFIFTPLSFFIPEIGGYLVAVKDF